VCPILSNNGGSPARDIDINIKLAGTFQIVGQSDFPPEPEEPRLPELPNTTVSMFGNISERIKQAISFPSFRPLPKLVFPQPPVVEPIQGPYIRSTNPGYQVQYHVERVKHHRSENLPAFYVEFSSFEDASSIEMGYELLAENSPEPKEGTLKIVVNKSS
jgi:hypothetical protein